MKLIFLCGGLLFKGFFILLGEFGVVLGGFVVALIWAGVNHIGDAIVHNQFH